MLSKTHSPAPTKVSVPAKQKTQGQQRDVTKAHHSGPHTYKQWLQLGSRAFAPIGRCCIRVGDLIIIFLTRKERCGRTCLQERASGWRMQEYRLSTWGMWQGCLACGCGWKVRNASPANMGTMEVLVLPSASKATSPGAAPGSVKSYKNGCHIRQP